MTILVHGAAGFVGTSLIPELVRAGFRDLSLTDLHAMPNIVTPSVGGLHSVSTQADGLEDFLNDEITTIISLAGQTDVDAALANPKHAFEANTGIAIQLGEFLRRNKRRPRLIYLSSDEVLGESFRPLPEDAPLRPTQPYAASKAAAELILRNYSDVYGLPIVCLRSCNLVGPLQRAKKLVPVAVKCMCTSVPVPIFGDGRHLREWMAVEDLCAAIVCLISAPANSGAFQATTNVHISVAEVVDIVANAIGREPRVHMAHDRLVHDRSYSMQPDRLRSLGWRPQIDPRLAIARTARALADPTALNELRFPL